ncbi:SGNH/GDSL hydrolase family protein [Emticicia sp. BO119]|uniref:SGNH/GDSL hydrolase family protein n=1 Tax=Emticicia sp. BO119 TaxID=2757768 RepID=UPI0015F013F8|nr:SGNH/GDSL hydrolase family protein [Emticicia sp. BO119]MBA4851775.1 SGNH/GDSL hydrolase family protein [Emticicia sp. BO119]
MSKIITFILSIGLFLSCAMTDTTEMVSIPKPIGTGPDRTFLALGDSYTIGESVLEKDRWSMYLIDLLKDKFTITKHDIIARTGWTTEELIQAIADSKNTNQYDMVSLLIGVNNQYRGQSIDKYRAEFRELLQISARFAHGDFKKVFVLSIPDYGVTPFAASRNTQKIAKEIDEFNTVAKDECRKAGVPFLDITSITREHTDAAYIASDQLHFSGKMHELWAIKARSTAEIILRE